MNGHLTAASKAFDGGNYAAAILSYEAALKLDPPNQTARDGLEQARKAKEAEEEVLRRLKKPNQ